MKPGKPPAPRYTCPNGHEAKVGYGCTHCRANEVRRAKVAKALAEFVGPRLPPRRPNGLVIGKRTIRAWSAMKSRCDNPDHPAYSYYGGRGIKVCRSWSISAANFVADMGENPEGMSLDRIDNEKGYEPGNCRWVDSKTQAINIRPAQRNPLRQRGIRRYKDHNRFFAYITVDYRLKYLGAFDTLDEAGHAYNKAAIHYQGEFAALNPIGVDPRAALSRAGEG